MFLEVFQFAQHLPWDALRSWVRFEVHFGRVFVSQAIKNVSYEKYASCDRCLNDVRGFWSAFGVFRFRFQGPRRTRETTLNQLLKVF